MILGQMWSILPRMRGDSGRTILKMKTRTQNSGRSWRAPGLRKQNAGEGWRVCEVLAEASSTLARGLGQ